MRWDVCVQKINHILANRVPCGRVRLGPILEGVARASLRHEGLKVNHSMSRQRISHGDSLRRGHSVRTAVDELQWFDVIACH